MSRKTISLDILIDYTNGMLASTGSKDSRTSAINLIEFAMEHVDNYQGYTYLTNEVVPKGQLPGIQLDESGVFLAEDDVRFINTDDTRRCYQLTK